MLAASVALCGVSSVPAFAQSNAARWRAVPVTATRAREPGDMVRLYTTDHHDLAPHDRLPPNLAFPESYRPILTAMLERSPMFRRQCLRIANTPYVRVLLRTLQTAVPTGPRARTTIRRTVDGALIATVLIRPLEDMPELIAHELEHIIEQLDGVDLSERASISSSGVHLCEDGSYETTRARHVGLIVGRDTRRGS